MSLSGPILVVSDCHDRKLAAALSAAGAFPMVECRLAEAASAIRSIEPAAVLFADPELAPIQSLADSLTDAIDAQPAPFMPVMARVKDCGSTILDVLPISAEAPVAQIVARLAAVLRARCLHATVLRRIDTLHYNGSDVPQLAQSDPLEDATVLVAGRGRTYPALSTAVGERVGLIGALNVETAAHHLNNRDVDGVIIGEGFGANTVEALLTALVEDPRFRDLPIGVVPDLPPLIDRAGLCGIEPVGGEPEDIVAHMLPLVRVHAFNMRLNRHVAALDARGLIDPQTGLTTIAAFERELPRAVKDAHERNIPLSMARFCFQRELSLRVRLDVARLVSRLIRAADFACQAEDGSIIVVFAEKALRHAHVIVRRIASVMRHTMLDREHENGGRVEAAVTLATLKATDTVQSLLARVCEPATVAAE
jgi:GGDEF domain-containing protein